jgi:hypothetical protein
MKDIQMDTHTDGQAYRWTDIQMEKRTDDMHTDGQTYRWTDIKMERRTVDIHTVRLLIYGCRVR